MTVIRELAARYRAVLLAISLIAAALAGYGAGEMGFAALLRSILSAIGLS